MLLCPVTGHKALQSGEKCPFDSLGGRLRMGNARQTWEWLVTTIGHVQHFETTVFSLLEVPKRDLNLSNRSPLPVSFFLPPFTLQCGVFKAYFDSPHRNKKLAINYYKAVLQSLGNPFYPLCLKWLYLLSLVFRNIKLYSARCKPSYFAFRFIVPSVDIAFT